MNNITFLLNPRKIGKAETANVYVLQCWFWSLSLFVFCLFVCLFTCFLLLSAACLLVCLHFVVVVVVALVFRCAWLKRIGTFYCQVPVGRTRKTVSNSICLAGSQSTIICRNVTHHDTFFLAMYLLRLGHTDLCALGRKHQTWQHSLTKDHECESNDDSRAKFKCTAECDLGVCGEMSPLISVRFLLRETILQHLLSGCGEALSCAAAGWFFRCEMFQ